jgi:hypothetical protein
MQAKEDAVVEKKGREAKKDVAVVRKQGREAKVNSKE